MFFLEKMLEKKIGLINKRYGCTTLIWINTIIASKVVRYIQKLGKNTYQARRGQGPKDPINRSEHLGYLPTPNFRLGLYNSPLRLPRTLYHVIINNRGQNWGYNAIHNRKNHLVELSVFDRPVESGLELQGVDILESF